MQQIWVHSSTWDYFFDDAGHMQMHGSGFFADMASTDGPGFYDAMGTSEGKSEP